MEANDKEIKVMTHDSAPRYETSGAACFDIAIAEAYTLNPGELHNFSTGLHVETQKQDARTVDSAPQENNDINCSEFSNSSKHRRLKR